MVSLVDQRKAGAQIAASMQQLYWPRSLPLLHCKHSKLLHAPVGASQAAHQRVAGPLTDGEVRVVGEALRWMAKKKTWTFICTHLLPYRQPQPASARWRAHEKAHGRQAGKAGTRDKPQPALRCVVVPLERVLLSHRAGMQSMLLITGHIGHRIATSWTI